MPDEDDAYSRPENAFRTDGRDVCHWCASRPQEWVWGPYGTRTCDYCEQMIDVGRAHDIVEEVAARITVRDDWFIIQDAEGWRRREKAQMDQWLQLRTIREPAPMPEPRGSQEGYVEPEWLREAREIPDEPFDPDSI